MKKISPRLIDFTLAMIIGGCLTAMGINLYDQMHPTVSCDPGWALTEDLKSCTRPELKEYPNAILI